MNTEERSYDALFFDLTDIADNFDGSGRQFERMLQLHDLLLHTKDEVQICREWHP